MYIFYFAAIIVGVMGSLLLYLSSPNQKLLEQRLDFKFFAAIGGGCLVLSLVLFGQALSLLTAIFCLFLLMMLVWSLLPFVAFLRAGEGG